MDKSKVNSLAKGLVCIQGCWMLVQGVARKFHGLPVTLLELNTIIHVVCALLMYLLWLKKPQEVETPTIIYGSHRGGPLGALLSIREVEHKRLQVTSTQDCLVLRWKDGVFEHKMRGSDAWAQKWNDPQASSAALMSLAGIIL